MSVYGLALRFLNLTKGILPAQWRLPIRYQGLIRGRDVEPELKYLYRVCRGLRGAVDVGANHGFYAYKMAEKFERVFAFEPNRAEDFDILYFQKPNLHFFPHGLSDETRQAELHIPLRDGMPYTGWASVNGRDLPFANGTAKTPIQLQRLDDQPFVREWPIDLIKIDVEGHELETIRGGLETIRRHRPVLILENNEPQAAAIQALLASLGYRSTTFAELTGVPLDSPNLIYLPD